MNHFINIKDIPIFKLRKIISDARKRKLNRKRLNILDIDKDEPLKGKLLIQMFENLAIVRPVCSSVNVKSVKSAPIFANLSSEKIVLPSCNIVNV